MSVFVNRKALCIALAGALVSATSAMAALPSQVVRGPVRVGNPNAAACAVGFTAAPATINAANPYNQSYVCTGPTIVCSPSFKAQDSIAGTAPSTNGGFGTTIYGSPVTIKGGRMVYTCAQPPAPPK